MRVAVNGEVHELPEDRLTLDDLLVRLALPLDRVAVEHNGRVIRRPERAAHLVRDGDVLEVVTLVGGG